MLLTTDETDLNLSVEEIVVCSSVVMSSGLTLEAIMSKSRTHDYVMARSVLGIMLCEIGCTLTRSGFIINRDHATILHYKRTHQANMLYHKGYKEVYESANLEYYTSHRVRTIKAMEKELLIMQQTLAKYKGTI